jgi:hypothetical protein
MQPRQYFHVAARFLRGQQRNRLPDAVFVHQIIDVTAAKELPGVALCLFGNFHFCFGRDALLHIRLTSRSALPIFYFAS